MLKLLVKKSIIEYNVSEYTEKRKLSQKSELTKRLTLRMTEEDYEKFKHWTDKKIITT